MVCEFRKHKKFPDTVVLYLETGEAFWSTELTEEIQQLFCGRERMYREVTIDCEGNIHIGKEATATF